MVCIHTVHFSVMTLHCNLEDGYQCSNLEDGGSTLLWYTGSHIPVNSVITQESIIYNRRMFKM